jgi:VanZ family protein
LEYFNRAQQNMRVTRQTLWWLEAAGWMVLIFSLSGESFAASRTLMVLQYFNHLFHLSLTQETLLLFNTVIRKTAHFGNYFVLGLLVNRAMAGGLFRFTWRRACWTMLVGLLYALSDEYHQSFTLSRTASLYDSGLDFTGVVASQLFILLSSVFFPAGGTRVDSNGDPPTTGAANAPTRI